jgi:hypothetical protein
MFRPAWVIFRPKHCIEHIKSLYLISVKIEISVYKIFNYVKRYVLKTFVTRQQ